MKGKLVGFDFELNTLTIQFESLDNFRFSVRDVEVSELGFKPTFEEMENETMDIHSKPGTKVIFTGNNSHDWEQEEARILFVPGISILTVSGIDIGSFETSVFFEEVPGRSFNSVMFANLKDTAQPIQREE